MSIPEEPAIISPIHLLGDIIQIYTEFNLSILLWSRETEYKLMFGSLRTITKRDFIEQLTREVGLSMTFESENSFTIILDPCTILQ